jgi:hypothetical protein
MGSSPSAQVSSLCYRNNGTFWLAASGILIMTWVVNLIIQIIAGIAGGHAAAAAVHDHKFGALGHSVTGAAGGAITGLFLQSFVAPVESSIFGNTSTLEFAVGEAIVGAVAGAMATLIVGFFKKEMDQRKLG